MVGQFNQAHQSPASLSFHVPRVRAAHSHSIVPPFRVDTPACGSTNGRVCTRVPLSESEGSLPRSPQQVCQVSGQELRLMPCPTPWWREWGHRRAARVSVALLGLVLPLLEHRESAERRNPITEGVSEGNGHQLAHQPAQEQERWRVWLLSLHCLVVAARHVGKHYKSKVKSKSSHI